MINCFKTQIEIEMIMLVLVEEDYIYNTFRLLKYFIHFFYNNNHKFFIVIQFWKLSLFNIDLIST